MFLPLYLHSFYFFFFFLSGCSCYISALDGPGGCKIRGSRLGWHHRVRWCIPFTLNKKQKSRAKNNRRLGVKWLLPWALFDSAGLISDSAPRRAFETTHGALTKSSYLYNTQISLTLASLFQGHILSSHSRVNPRNTNQASLLSSRLCHFGNLKCVSHWSLYCMADLKRLSSAGEMRLNLFRYAWRYIWFRMKNRMDAL